MMFCAPLTTTRCLVTASPRLKLELMPGAAKPPFGLSVLSKGGNLVWLLATITIISKE